MALVMRVNVRRVSDQGEATNPQGVRSMANQRHLAGHNDTPGLYVITVDGTLDPDWSDRVSGMQISPVSGSDVPQTRLTGWLVDQGSLHGVLSILNSLAMPLVALERVRSGRDGGT
jgi:hypothetical protein